MTSVPHSEMAALRAIRRFALRHRRRAWRRFGCPGVRNRPRNMILRTSSIVAHLSGMQRSASAKANVLAVRLRSSHNLWPNNVAYVADFRRQSWARLRRTELARNGRWSSFLRRDALEQFPLARRSVRESAVNYEPTLPLRTGPNSSQRSPVNRIICICLSGA